MAYWEGFFKAHPTQPLDLKLYIDILNKKRRFKDIEAAFRAYPKHLPKGAATQFWMYGELALAMKINRGSNIPPADVERIKEALGRSALLALKDGNPTFILTAADQMFLFGYYDVTVNVDGKPTRVAAGPLLDELAKKIPHRVEPLRYSLDLARRTLDPRRMADAMEKVLSMGWPKDDDLIRADVHRQVDELVDELNGEKREDEATELEGLLPGALGRDLLVRLTWDGNADLDLAVDEPLGATASHFTPRTVYGGALVKEGRGKDRSEIYVCPRAFPGDYTVHVEAAWQDPDKPPVTSAKLEIITRDGLPGSKTDVRKVTLKVDPKAPGSLNPKSAPEVIHLAAGRRKEVLPYVSLKPEAAAIILAPLPPDPKAPGAPGDGGNVPRPAAGAPQGKAAGK